MPSCSMLLLSAQLVMGTVSASKILCLHGGGGNAEGFRASMASIMQSAPSFEFVFVTAPYGGLWMRDPPGGKGQPTTDPTWDLQSLEMLDEVVATQGPFHGILGYSQGAAYAIAYLAHARPGTFSVAALFCGYLPTTHQGIMSRINARRALQTRAFVFMGANDYIITNAMSREAATAFVSPTISRSLIAGHHPPQPSDPTYDDFLRWLGVNPTAPAGSPPPVPLSMSPPSPLVSPPAPRTASPPAPTGSPQSDKPQSDKPQSDKPQLDKPSDEPQGSSKPSDWDARCIAADTLIEVNGAGYVAAALVKAGDEIRGAMGAHLQPAWCTVISNADHGSGRVVGNFTPGHMVARKPPTLHQEVTIVPSPDAEGAGRTTGLRNIVTDCELAETADGQLFTPFSDAFCNRELSWREYLILMSSVRKLASTVPFVWDVRNWRDSSSHPFFPTLNELCADIIECTQSPADSAACAHFDVTITTLVRSNLEPSKQAEFRAAWPESEAMIDMMHDEAIETPLLVITIVSGVALLVGLVLVGLVGYVIIKLRRLGRIDVVVQKEMAELPKDHPGLDVA